VDNILAFALEETENACMCVWRFKKKGGEKEESYAGIFFSTQQKTAAMFVYGCV